MMTQYQQDVVKLVYTRFLNSEEPSWTDIDENLQFFDSLSDQELINESIIKYEEHKRTGIRCSEDHPKDICFGPIVLDSVGAILELYEKTKNLHVKNRYVLMYYQT